MNSEVIKQLLALAGIVVVMIIAFRVMRKIKDVPEEVEMPLSEDLEEGEI